MRENWGGFDFGRGLRIVKLGFLRGSEKGFAAKLWLLRGLEDWVELKLGVWREGNAGRRCRDIIEELA